MVLIARISNAQSPHEALCFTANFIFQTIGAMSAIGTKRTYQVALHMSAIGGKADIAPASQNVR